MIVWGHYQRDRCEDTGTFDCPACGKLQPFEFIRTYRYFHIWFIPLFNKGVAADRVVCLGCESNHSIQVLQQLATPIDSPAAAWTDAGTSVMQQLGNVVELSPEATAEIERRRREGGYDASVAVRIEVEDAIQRKCRMGFDIPEADGRDWIGESGGLTILVDRRDAGVIHGATIRYRDGQFEW